MSNIDWVTIQKHLQEDTLREHFNGLFSTPKAAEAYVAYCQYFLSEYSTSSARIPEIAVSLPILRIFLLSIPGYVFRSIKCGSTVLDWLAAIISEKPMSFVGPALSNLCVLAKHLPLDDIVASLATSFQMALHRAASLINADSLSQDLMSLVIVLHQLEDLLNCIGSHSSLPVDVISSTQPDITVLLQFVCSEQVKSVPRTEGFIVDVVKLCAMIMEISVTSLRSSSTSSDIIYTESVLSMAQLLVTLTIMVT